MKSFEDEILTAHNEMRTLHGSPPMKWSAELSSHAQDWANHIAKRGKLEHAAAKERPGQGENLSMACGEALTGHKAVSMWYSEIKDFDFTKPAAYNPKCGHFTQVVWAESVELGAGLATSSDGTHFVVARYRPAGNMLSAFQSNVKPPAAPQLPNHSESSAARNVDSEERSVGEDQAVSNLKSQENIQEQCLTEVCNMSSRNVSILVKQAYKSPSTEKKNKCKTIEVTFLSSPVQESSHSSRTDEYLQLGQPYTLTHFIYS